MKNFLLLVLVSTSALASGPNLLKPMSCGGYKKVVSSGVTFDASKYSLVLEKAVNAAGTERGLTLYVHEADGSYEVAQGHGCQRNQTALLCELDGVSVELPLNQRGTDLFKGVTAYKAFITVPGTLYGKNRYEGTCQTSL